MPNKKSINNSEKIKTAGSAAVNRKKPGRKPAATKQAVRPSGTEQTDINRPLTGSDNEQLIRKRGRPKGSIDKTERKKRKDNDFQTAKPGQNTRTTNYALIMASLPNIDVNNSNDVKQRIIDYFNICGSFDLKPSVAGLALAFDIDRATLFNWLNHKTGTVQNKESFDHIKKAYKTINAMYETYLNDGSINPVSAFFMMKNNYGYKDTTDYIVTANQEQTVNLSDVINRAGLLSD